MNKNALTEQRRETVIGLLKNMNIKKSGDGGFDKDDVYESMQQLCDLYEKSIEELENAYETEISELRDRYQKYDDNNELYVSLIMEAKKSSNDIINQAKTEVETILAEGRDQVAKQEKDLEEMRKGMAVEKEAITKELNASREAVEAEKKAMWAEVEAEREKTTALKNKYTQQINAMEDEFAEIKTNILRTAGRIDSLKSKLVDEDEIEWDIEQSIGSGDIDFPMPDVGVEYDAAAGLSGAVNDTVEPEIAAAAEPAAVDAVAEEEPANAADADDAAAADDAGAIPQEANAADGGNEEVQELKLDDIEIDWPELKETPAQAAAAQETAPDEISFEGLEELFKDEE